MISRTEQLIPTGDGESIWCETAGTGTPLVLTHGLGGNGAVWFQQVPYFADRYRVVTWDQRGFGRSTNRTGRVGPRPAVTDLLRMLDQLDIDSAHLVGQSMGGWAVLGAALAAPHRVRSLVLASTTAGIPARHVPPFDPGLVGSAPGARPLGVHPAVGDRLPAVDPARAYLYQALGTFGQRPPDGDFARLLVETTHDARALASLQTPTLFVCGALDALMTPERVRDAAAHLPRAAVVELADRGHSGYFEDPAGWNEAVDGFLASVA